MLQQFFLDVLPWDLGTDHCCYIVSMCKEQNVNNPVRLYPVSSAKQAVVTVQTIEQEANPPVDIYLAVSSYVKAPHRRKFEHVYKSKCIVVDIDSDKIRNGVVKEGQYHTQQDAIQAAVEFFKTTKLFPTYVINSGRGIHIYWAFDQSITKEQRIILGNYFILLCKTYNLKIDVPVTKDVVRIIRCPETLHVTANVFTQIKLNTGLVYSPKAFTLQLRDLLVAQNVDINDSVPALGAVPTPYTGVLPTVGDTTQIDQALAPYFGNMAPQIDAEKCVKHCKQLQNCGFASEPVWFAAAQVFAHCYNGREIFHRLSAMDSARYNVTVCDAKLLSVQQYGYKPALCSAFHSMNPKLCQGCPWFGKIPSPISLYKLAVEPVVAKAEPPPLALPNNSNTFITVPVLNLDNITADTAIDYQTCANRTDFFQNNSGIFKREIDPDTGQASTTIVSNGRIIFHKLSVSIYDGITEFSYWFNVYLPGRNIPFPTMLPANQCLSKKDLCAWASGSGLSLMPYQQNEFFEFMNAYLAQIRANPLLTVPKSVEAMGWQTFTDTQGKEETAFVVGTSAIFTNGSISNITVSGDPSSSITSLYSHAGTLAEWAKIPKLYAQFNQPFAQLAMCFSFAAPFMVVLPQEATNCLLSLYSTDGGKGKTHLARACASVWGTPRAGFVQANSSIASKEKHLATIRNFPIFVDEITTMGAEEIRTLVFEFINGTEKNKLRRDSSIKKTGKWNTVCLITSNYSIKDLVNSVFPESNAGVLRVLEYECDFALPQGVSSTYVSEIFSILDNNYGIAGPVFVHQMMNNPHILEQLRAQVLSFVTKYKFKPEERFYSYAIGLALIIGRFCVNLGLLNYDIDQLEQWATTAFIQVIRRVNDTLQEDPKEALLGLIHDCIASGLWVRSSRNSQKPEIPAAAYMPGGYVIKYPTNNKEFVARLELDTGRVYIARRAFTTYRRKHNCSLKSIQQHLRELGLYYSEGYCAIGHGTVLQTARERVFIIDFPDYQATTGGDLQQLKQTFAILEQKAPSVPEQ